MNIFNKLNLALTRTGYSPLRSELDYEQVGAGAGHDAYRVHPSGHEALVIRLRIQIIYGRREEWDPPALQEDYAPVGLYYQEANRCRAGVCPEFYDYRIDPDIVFTIESYLPGEPLPLEAMSNASAEEVGDTLGIFFREIHGQDAPIPGHGLLVWDGTGVAAESPDPVGEIGQKREAEAQAQMELLAASDVAFDRPRIQKKLDQMLAARKRAAEPVSLVNQDITPENLLVRSGEWIGLVDPVPALDNGTYYAAWFTHCYCLFLPSLSNAPRYAGHNFAATQRPWARSPMGLNQATPKMRPKPDKICHG